MLERTSSLVDTRPSLEVIHRAIVDSDVVVDALLGTGLTGEVGGVYAKIIEDVNRNGRQVLSLDIPSGVDGSTGRVEGVAVRADYTVTFGLPKRGNLLYPGADRAGRLFVSHISFPPELRETDSIKVALNEPSPLPRRPVNGHKGTFGDVLFVAGAASYFGSPTLSAMSMLKAGGGYLRLATPGARWYPSPRPWAARSSSPPSRRLQRGAWPGERRAAFGAEPAKQIQWWLGPGLSLDEETQELARVLVARIDKPLLLDGDGLTAAAAKTK